MDALPPASPLSFALLADWTRSARLLRAIFNSCAVLAPLSASSACGRDETAFYILLIRGERNKNRNVEKIDVRFRNAVVFEPHRAPARVRARPRAALPYSGAPMRVPSGVPLGLGLRPCDAETSRPFAAGRARFLKWVAGCVPFRRGRLPDLITLSEELYFSQTEKNIGTACWFSHRHPFCRPLLSLPTPPARGFSYFPFIVYLLRFLLWHRSLFFFLFFA